jgi:hypothetical protein
LFLELVSLGASALVGTDRSWGLLTAWAVSVENACDSHVDAVLVVETVCQSLGDALPLVVARAWTDGVDVTPATRQRRAILINRLTEFCDGDKRVSLLIFWLWMYLRVAINLYFHFQAGRGVSGTYRKETEGSPDVLVNKKRAFVRFARPSMFKVPWKDVLIVFTALNW